MFGFNKTGTTEVGAISKAQKAQSFKICVGHFHENKRLDIALSPDITRGDSIKSKGVSFEDKKFEKSRTVPKKVERGTLCNNLDAFPGYSFS